MVVVSDNSAIKIGGIKLDKEFFGRKNFVIPVIAEKQIISVTKYIEHTLKFTSSYRTYVPYYAVWGTEYEFKPGKSYKINVRTANLSYEGGRLTSSDSRVRITGEGTPTIYFEGDDFIIIEEYDFGLVGGLIGSVYIGPYFNSGADILFWDSGPGLGLNLGPRLSLQMSVGNFDFSFNNIAIGAGYGVLNHKSTYLNSDVEDYWRSTNYVELIIKTSIGSYWIGGG